MQKPFANLSLSSFDKVEFSELGSRVVGITRKYSDDVYHLDGVLQFLVNEQEEFNKIIILEPSNELKKEIKPLCIRRNALLQTLRNQLFNHKRADVESLRSSVFVATRFINTYLPNTKFERFERRNNRVDQILAELNSNEALKSAFDKLSLTAQMAELKAIHLRIKSLDADYISLKAERPNYATLKELRRKVSKSLTHFIYTIELSQKQYPEVDYTPLMNELNVLFGEMNAKVKSKNTRKNTRKSKLMTANVKVDNNNQEAV